MPNSSTLRTAEWRELTTRLIGPLPPAGGSGGDPEVLRADASQDRTSATITLEGEFDMTGTERFRAFVTEALTAGPRSATTGRAPRLHRSSALAGRPSHADPVVARGGELPGELGAHCTGGTPSWASSRSTFGGHL
jgi:hypothetical protein